MEEDARSNRPAALPAELCFDIRGADLFDVLCRTLDQVRRMGIRLNSVSAAAETESIELRVFEPERQLSQTLAERIAEMSGVTSVAIRTA